MYVTGRPKKTRRKKNVAFNKWITNDCGSMRKAAEKLGVSTSAVFNWCHALATPSYRKMATINKVSNGIVTPTTWLKTVNL